MTSKASSPGVPAPTKDPAAGCDEAVRARLAAKGISLAPAHPVTCECKGTGTVPVAQFSSGLAPCSRIPPSQPGATPAERDGAGRPEALAKSEVDDLRAAVARERERADAAEFDRDEARRETARAVEAECERVTHLAQQDVAAAEARAAAAERRAEEAERERDHFQQEYVRAYDKSVELAQAAEAAEARGSR